MASNVGATCVSLPFDKAGPDRIGTLTARCSGQGGMCALLAQLRARGANVLTGPIPATSKSRRSARCSTGRRRCTSSPAHDLGQREQEIVVRTIFGGSHVGVAVGEIERERDHLPGLELAVGAADQHEWRVVVVVGGAHVQLVPQQITL